MRAEEKLSPPTNGSVLRAARRQAPADDPGSRRRLRDRPVKPATTASNEKFDGMHGQAARAFSSEAGTGSREENASKQKIRAFST
jgi:hypothetical protein